MTKTLIMLCTYNERENITELIPELHAVAPDATILIIDDNSPDGTGRLATQLSTIRVFRFCIALENRDWALRRWQAFDTQSTMVLNS